MGKDKLHDVPHDIKCCECESELYLAELYCPNCEARPALILGKDAVADVPCNVGLAGLTLDDTRCIHEALSLMNCMILGGEKHTLKSEKILYEAQQALRKAS